MFLEVSLSVGAQLTQGPTCFKQRDAKPLGELPKRLALAQRAGLGHTIEIEGGDELGVHGEGDGRGQLQLIDLLPHIARDKFNGRLHFGYHPLGFIDAIQTPLTELFLLSNTTNRFDLSTEIGSDQVAVSPHAAFEIDKVIGLANGFNALFDLLALLAQTLVLLAGRFKRLLGLLELATLYWTS